MAKVIGMRPTVYDFKDKEGKQIYSEGFTFYISYPQKDTEGVACDKVYLSNSKFNELPNIGDEIEIFYNRFNKPAGFRFLD